MANNTRKPQSKPTIREWNGMPKNTITHPTQHVDPKYNGMAIMGDFNHPEIDWESVTTEKNINHSSQQFIDAIRDAYLHQHVTQPTRYRHGQNHNLLDLILTSSEDSVSNLEYHAGIALSL